MSADGAGAASPNHARMFGADVEGFGAVLFAAGFDASAAPASTTTTIAGVVVVTGATGADSVCGCRHELNAAHVLHATRAPTSTTMAAPHPAGVLCGACFVFPQFGHFVLKSWPRGYHV